MENTNEVEREKLTLAAIFIATYTGLLFSIPQILSASPDSLFKEIIYSLFVLSGGVIDIVFFLYVAFYALELSSSKTKIITLFKIPLQQGETQNIRRRLFDIGVDFIFTSFSLPFLLIIEKTQTLFLIDGWFGSLVRLMMAIVLWLLITIATKFIFRLLKE